MLGTQAYRSDHSELTVNGGRSVGGHRAGRYSQISYLCDDFKIRPIRWGRMRYLNSKCITDWKARRRRTPLCGKSTFVHRRPTSVKTVVAVTFLTFNLAACGGAESVYVIGASLANFIHTDRVPLDYIAEYASGQECNLLKSIEDGGPLCRKSFTRTVIEPPLYCYRTIGKPSCYVSPDPYKTGAQTIK